MNLSTLDLSVVAIYAVVLLVLAQWVSREKAGHKKDSSDYFLAGRSLPWWAIGASLIAANISAEQIIGMSGSAWVLGIAIAAYEWMAAHHVGHRRQVAAARVPEAQDLHDAAVPRAALRPPRTQRHGAVLARHLRVRQPDVDPLAGCTGREYGHWRRPDGRADRARRFRHRLLTVRWAQSRGIDRHHPGHRCWFSVAS